MGAADVLANHRVKPQSSGFRAERSRPVKDGSKIYCAGDCNQQTRAKGVYENYYQREAVEKGSGIVCWHLGSSISHCKMYVYRLFILDANVLIFTMLWLLYTIVNINIPKRNHQRTTLGKALRAWIKQLAEPASLTCLGFLLYVSLQCKCYTTRCHVSSTVAVV